MKIFIIIISCFISNSVFSQIAIGKETLNPHAQLDIVAEKKGLLIPRVILKDIKLPDPFDTGVDPLPESLLVYNTGGKLAIASGYYYWSNNQWNKLVIKDELEGVIPDKDISSKELTITPDGKGAVLRDIELTINDKAVTPAKIKGGLSGQILTSGKDGPVVWKAPVPADITGKNLTSDHLEIKPDGKGAVLKETKLTIKKSVINTAMLQDKAVIPSKISPGGSNQILTTNKEGDAVVWANSNTVDGKTMTSPHLEINGGEGAVLKDIELTIKNSVIENDMIKDQIITGSKINPGGSNQILTTNKEGATVVWANRSGITNKLESIDPNKNFVRSTVNDVKAETKIIKEVKNTLKEATKDGYPLRTFVNGIGSNFIDIPEPWNVSKSEIKATENTQNIYQMGNVGIGTKEVDYPLSVEGKVRFLSLPKTEKLEKYLITMPDDPGLLSKVKLTDDIMVQKGIIIMWFGAENTIPGGWALCDGNNGTPKLTDRFIMGAGKGNENKTGGEKEVTLTIAQMPKHTHKGWFSHDLEGRERQNGKVKVRTTGMSSYKTTNVWSGETTPHENRPPYYTLFYIMKL